METDNKTSNSMNDFLKSAARIAVPILVAGFAALREANASYVSLQVLPVLGQAKMLLAQIGPTLSGVLFIAAGIFYALGQLLPPDKKAQFHTTAVNVVIGAIVVGVLSVASTSLATASTHLLSNFTANSVNVSG